MAPTNGSLRLIVAILALVALVAVIALPALAAESSGSPSPAASEPTATTEPTATSEATATSAPAATEAPVPTTEPTAANAAEPTPATPGEDGEDRQMPEKPPKPAKADKAKGEPVTISGTVGTRTDADGQTEYTLTAGSTVVVLDAGPPWYLGDDHPLAGSVGDRVTIVGTQRAGEDEVDVETVDGQAIRAPGKPPWAGGWKAVGERHPGWSEEKAARAAERAARHAERNAAKAAAHGTECWPPGHCKDGSAEGATATNPPGD